MRTGQIQGARGPVTLSKVVFGTTYIGSDIPLERSMELLDTYYRLGGRTIDTAHVYGQEVDDGVSRSEQVVGRWLRERGCREEITLITKGGHPPLADFNGNRLTRECIHRDMAGSLELLGTGCVDVYFLHRDNESVPVEGIVDALHELVLAGKARAIGASNWRLERILAANRYAAAKGKTPFTVSQIQWSLAKCDAESWGDDTLVFMDRELCRRYREEGIPVMAYSSQAKGLFSKYIAGGEAALTDKTRRFFCEENLRRVEQVRALSQSTGLSPAAICLGYIGSHPLEGFPIVGCSKLEQLEDSMTVADVTLPPETVAQLEA